MFLTPHGSDWGEEIPTTQAQERFQRLNYDHLQYVFTGLKPGKSVVVTETRAPDGFILDTQSQAIQIKEGRTVTLTFKNQPKGKY